MFRPCIDLHEGKVKQIVGGTLSPDGERPRENFVAAQPASWFAARYRADGLQGGHVILLDQARESVRQAREALAAYPGGLQLGGGVKADNAAAWLDAGASHVIVTSWVFQEGRLRQDRLDTLVAAVGADRLVLDLSCRKRGDAYWIVTDRWTRFTAWSLSAEVLAKLARQCAEFLVHAVDVEGLRCGIDEALVARLADWTPIPLTYAGGANSLADLETVTRLGRGKIHLTIGSALDLFGGTGVRYADALAFNRGLAGPTRSSAPSS